MERACVHVPSPDEPLRIGGTTRAIRLSWIERLAGAAFLLLLALSLTGTFLSYFADHAALRRIGEMFMFQEERNLPTLFNFALLVVNAAAFGAVAMFAFGDHDRWRWHWLVLALLFLLLSYDEAAQVHERIGRMVETLVEVGGYLTFGWVIPGAVVVLLFGLAYIRFLRALPRRNAALFVLAVVMYVGGAIGVEMLEAKRYATNGFDLIYSLMATIEESLEMTALIVLLHATLGMLAGSGGVLQFELRRLAGKNL